MYRNVQVNHNNNATTTTTPSSSSSSSSFALHTNQKATSLPVQITSTSFPSPHNSNTGEISSSLPISYIPSNEIMSVSSSSSSKLKTDVDQLDDLVKDLLTEVNRPISDNNNKQSTSSYSYHRHSNNDLSNSNNQKAHEFDDSSNSTQRSKTTREERIRIKRGVGTEIPVTTSSSSMTTATTTTKPQTSSSVDEQLIDSLLESVQNTLRKRSQQNQSTWTPDIPIRHGMNNRRTYSSNAACTDSIHRVS
jgi:hypothetical protein